ncbi:PD-(D/E)XK nuclease family protein [Meiothermus cerbereus]|uniref:PD-(D/E)XK nuclease family protein n=1 Tax=Meiothermus cerbereus TaxID=65552 RepID=UPI003EEA1AE6
MIQIEDLVPPREKAPNPFRLSSAGKCARRLAYELHYPGEVPPVEPRVVAIFELGSLIHDWLREKLAALYGERFHSVERAVELEVDPGFAVPGRIDGILETESGPVLLDIKSASDKSAQSMSSNGVPYDYVAQVNAYLEATGLQKGLLVVYNKNTSEITTLPVDHDPAVVAQVKERFRAVRCSTPEQLPEREYETDSFACRYCPFRGRCWGASG